jgi:hypothetical protein
MAVQPRPGDRFSQIAAASIVLMAPAPDDELVKDVFAHYGLAAYLAHALERALVTALTTAYGPRSTKLTEQELDQRFEQLSDRRPATLIRVLREAGLSSEIMPAVRGALRDRNRLVHQFFWNQAIEFTTVEGCHRMLAELTEMQYRFGDCTEKVEAEVHRWAAGHGISAGDREAIHHAMLERGHVLSDAEIDELVRSRPARGERA